MGKGWVLALLALVVVITSISALFVTLKQRVEVKQQRQDESMVKTQTPAPAITERVTFTTDDGVEIVADYTYADGSRFAGILLHAMPTTRQSFSELTKQLVKAGWSTLAIDLRGHGESLNSVKGKLDYQAFSDTDQQAKIFDLVGASRFLEGKGFDRSHQFLVGASIGANLALQFLSEHREVRAAVLLSPGLSYHGIQTESLLREDIGEQVMLVATEEDAYAFQTVTALHDKAKRSELVTYPIGGHGTEILGQQSTLIPQLISWLKGKVL